MIILAARQSAIDNTMNSRRGPISDANGSPERDAYVEQYPDVAELL
jgi:hypothetical protein